VRVLCGSCGRDRGALAFPSAAVLKESMRASGQFALVGVMSMLPADYADKLLSVVTFTCEGCENGSEKGSDKAQQEIHFTESGGNRNADDGAQG